MLLIIVSKKGIGQSFRDGFFTHRQTQAAAALLRSTTTTVAGAGGGDHCCAPATGTWGGYG